MVFDPLRLERLAGWMGSWVDSGRLPGASTLILQGGEEVYFHATGHRDVGTQKSFDRDTVVRIYSMTKPITSVALMLLVERGLLQLDSPVSDFIPTFSDTHALVPNATRIDQTEPCNAPTIHQLLTHTSGLSYSFNPGVLASAMHEKQLLFKSDQGLLEAMVDEVAALPLAFKPGTRWEYSVGIDVIGRVIEVVSGKTFADFLETEIFSPLDMGSTAFAVRSDQLPQFASLYTPLAGDIFDLNAAQPGESPLREVENAHSSPFAAPSMLSGGGGLISTIDDYAKFAEVFHGRSGPPSRRLLSPSTLAFMMRNHLEGDIASMGPQSFAEQPMTGMGFGLGGATVLDPALARCPGSVGDFGWGGMASTFFWVDPVQDMTVIYFTQLAPSSYYPLRSQLKALVHGALVRPV